jgi:hypothetical protein
LKATSATTDGGAEQPVRPKKEEAAAPASTTNS